MSQFNWCDIDAICMDEIENRAVAEITNGNFPTLLFISTDLYSELQKLLAAQMRYGGTVPAMGSAGSRSIMSINTSAGSLNVQVVQRLRNFLMVGRKEDFELFLSIGVDPMFWNNQERVKVDRAFEDFILAEEEPHG